MYSITAKTARILASGADDSRTTVGERVPACVYRDIYRAAKKGEYSVQVGSLTMEQCARLGAQGFAVTRPFSRLFDGCEISWAAE